jgi:AsmA protein
MMGTTSPSREPGRRGFPLWAKIVLGLFVVLLLLVLALPYALNVDRYRDSIAREIEKETGRQVTLGKIRVTFLPGVGLVVEDLHIGNPPGFPQGDVVSAGEIRVNLEIGPLLHSMIHLNSLELVSPKVTLVTDDHGKNNYTFTSSTPGQETPPKAANRGATAKTDEASSGVSLDRIDSLLLTGAEVSLETIVRGQVEPSADVKGINVTMHNFVLSPIALHDWQADSKLSGVTLALGGWSAPIAFRLGQLQLADGKLDAQFVADLAKASDIKGTLNVPDIVHPHANFEMSASELDIDKLMAAVGGEPSGPSSQPTKAADPPPSGPSDLVARGHINVEKITTKPYAVGPANVEIRIYTDRAELWPISIGMYGGTLQISSRVDRAASPPRFTATVQMRNLDVAKVLDVSPAARGKMGGIGELDLNLLGGLSDAWKKTLSGTGKFAVRNGHLPGVNLAGAAQSVAKIAGVGGDTPFTVLEGDITIAEQRVSSKQIHLDSAVGTVDLRGSVGLDGSLDYLGQVVVSPGAVAGSGIVGSIVGGLLSSRVSKITVPIALGGTIESPKVQPGKGIPSFAGPSNAPGTTGSSAPAGPPAAPENPVDTIKNLFKKH